MAAGRLLVVTEHAAAQIFALDDELQQLAVRALEWVRDSPTGPGRRLAPFPHRPGLMIALFDRLVIIYRFDADVVEIRGVRISVDP